MRSASTGRSCLPCATALFEPLRPPRLRPPPLPIAEVKPAIFGHPEFTAFTTQVTGLFTEWQTARRRSSRPSQRTAIPSRCIETIAEDLLATFKTAPLLDAYDVYQHLMDYWAETMQDDCYLIADAGWKAGAKPREIRQVKNKDGKLVWPEKEDYRSGKRRFKSDLVPATLLIARYFAAERDAIAALEAELAASSSNSTRGARSKAARKGCSPKSSKARARSRRSPPKP